MDYILYGNSLIRTSLWMKMEGVMLVDTKLKVINSMISIGSYQKFALLIY